MRIACWNIQYGCGLDGAVDLARIAETIKGWAPDVICLQEVGRFMPELDGGSGQDQFTEIARHFPQHAAVFGPVFDRLAEPGSARRQFGNMLLSRLPVLQVFHHQLPCPADPGIKQMPRALLEAVLRQDERCFRVMTTHLAFHSVRQRMAQVERIREIAHEAWQNEVGPAATDSTGPFAAVSRPSSAIFCGDLNLLVASPEYQALLAPFKEDLFAWADVWPQLYGDRAHEPTCGLFDREQWPEGTHCRDFFVVTEDLLPQLTHLEVNGESEASDHQPLCLSIDLS